MFDEEKPVYSLSSEKTNTSFIQKFQSIVQKFRYPTFTENYHALEAGSPEKNYVLPIKKIPHVRDFFYWDLLFYGSRN